MRFREKYVDVRISRRILFVGVQAYPLQMVTRIQPLELRLDHRTTALNYCRRAGAWIGLGVAELFVIGCLGQAVPSGLYAVATLVILGGLGWHTYRLVRRLTLPKLFALSVATAGTAHAALISRDEALVHDLAGRVVDAIDNPAVDYAIKVEHVEAVFGDKIAGDKVEGDKLVFDS